MNYQEWLTTVPPEITQDPLWKLEVYRLGMFVAEIGWEDVVILSRNNLNPTFHLPLSIVVYKFTFLSSLQEAL